MNFKSKIKIFINLIINFKFTEILELIKFLKYFSNGWKIVILRNERIGHQVLNTFSFLTNISSKESYKYQLAVSNPRRFSCNQFITNYWDEFLRKRGYIVFSGNITTFCIDYLMKKNLKKSLKNDRSSPTKDFYISNPNSINPAYLNINDAGQIFNKNFQPLPKLNLEFINTPIYKNLKSLKYVCTYTRDSEYMNSLGLNQDFSYHNYRNDDYLKLIATVKFLNSKNLPVIRMGNIKRKISNKYFSKEHLDFENLSHDGSHEIILCSNCLFFIGDTSGLANAAVMFGRPVLRYNWIPIFNSQPHKTLVIPMLIKNKETGEYISFRQIWELRKKGLNLSDGYSYKKFNLEFVKNSSSEIVDASTEMLRRVQENDFESSHPKQKHYEKMMATLGCFNPGIIGYSFMEKYNYLFI